MLMGFVFRVSATEIKVPARGKALVPTDLSIAVPEGTYARIGKTSFSLSLSVGVLIFYFLFFKILMGFLF